MHWAEIILLIQYFIGGILAAVICVERTPHKNWFKRTLFLILTYVEIIGIIFMWPIVAATSFIVPGVFHKYWNWKHGFGFVLSA